MSDELRLPKPREVWAVYDDDVVLHEQNRVDKGTRYVLVLMKSELIISHQSVFNVIPLSASAKPDKLTIEIARGYEDTASGFSPKSTSCAVTNFYQPLEYPSFKSYKGRIEANLFEAIKNILVTEVIGHTDFDFTP